MEQVSSLKTGVKSKDTPIGKIPVDWEAVTLSQIAEINMGQSPPSKDCNEQGDGLPFYQGNAEFGSKYPSPQKWCKRPKKLADEGDILINVRAPVGEINIAPHKCCIGRGIAAVQAKDIHDKFLYQSMLLYRKNLQKMAQGSTFEAINRKELAELLTLLPPFPEQEKIADILTTVDGAIEKTAQVIEKTKELKKGLMQRFLTRGIEHKRFKRTEIGEIPEEWEVVKLGQVSDLKNGINFKKEQKGEKGILTIDVLNMYSTSIFINPIDLYRVDLDLISKEDYILKEGDILFVRSSVKREGVGWACLFKSINEKVTFCGFIIRARLIGAKISPEFLTYFLRSDRVRGRLISGAGQVAITNISQNTLQDLNIVIPSHSEQKEIVGILSSIDEQIEKESNHKEQLETLKKGLMQVLLTGKLRVAV